MALAAALAAAVPAALAALVVLQLDKTVITDRLVRDVSPTPISDELDPPEYTRTTLYIPSVGAFYKNKTSHMKRQTLGPCQGLLRS